MLQSFLDGNVGNVLLSDHNLNLPRPAPILLIDGLDIEQGVGLPLRQSSCRAIEDQWIEIPGLPSGYELKLAGLDQLIFIIDSMV